MSDAVASRNGKLPPPYFSCRAIIWSTVGWRKPRNEGGCQIIGTDGTDFQMCPDAFRFRRIAMARDARNMPNAKAIAGGTASAE